MSMCRRRDGVACAVQKGQDLWLTGSVLQGRNFHTRAVDVLCEHEQVGGGSAGGNTRIFMEGAPATLALPSTPRALWWCQLHCHGWLFRLVISVVSGW